MTRNWRNWLERPIKGLTPKGPKTMHKPVYARAWLLGILLAFWLAAFLSPHFDHPRYIYLVGDYTQKAIKAPRTFSMIDEATTEDKRAKAEALSLPVYDYDPALVESSRERVAAAFALMKAFYAQYEPPPIIGPVVPDNASDAKPEEKPVLPEIPAELENQKIQEFAAAIGTELTEKELALLKDRRFDVSIQRTIQNLIGQAMSGLLVADLNLFINSLPTGPLGKSFVKRSIQTQKEETVTDLQNVRNFQEVRDGIPEIAKKEAGDRFKKGTVALITKLSQAEIKPNLSINGNETSARKQLARNSVPQVVRSFQKGQLIVADGMQITEDNRRVLTELYKSQLASKPYLDFVGVALFCYFLLAAILVFSQSNIRKFKPDNKDILFLFVMLGMTVTLTWITQAASMGISERFERIPLQALHYGLPLAAAAMVVRFILNSEIALGFAVAVAVLLGLLFDRSLTMTFYILIGGIMGAHWIGRTQHRYSLMTAGLKVAVANMAVVIAIEMITLKPGGFQAGGLLAMLIGAGFSGVMSGLVVLAITPLIELVFSYTTDIKLMELANMNHPLLKEMVIKAPGTYNHSILVSTLAENAAEDIDANPILAKVGGLYQDIGKISKPHYFIENQGEMENPHDRLYPRMSALILLAHVKEGVELAHKYKLGERVADIIMQHHGTGLIKYFFSRAQEIDDGKGGGCAEEDFRYPGPKPQTREAGIVMLADIVEATTRTLKKTTASRIASVIETTTDNVFREGQLDECELTLRDLDAIAKSFQKVLTGRFHSRIEYPDQKAEGNRKKSDKDTDPKQTKDGEDPGRPDKDPNDKDTKVVKIH